MLQRQKGGRSVVVGFFTFLSVFLSIIDQTTKLRVLKAIFFILKCILINPVAAIFYLVS